MASPFSSSSGPKGPQHCLTLVNRATKALRDMGVRGVTLNVLHELASLIDSLGDGRQGGSTLHGVSARGFERLTGIDRETSRRAFSYLETLGVLFWRRGAGTGDGGTITLLRPALANLWVNIQDYLGALWLRRSDRAARRFSRRGPDSAELLVLDKKEEKAAEEPVQGDLFKLFRLTSLSDARFPSILRRYAAEMGMTEAEAYSLRL